MELNEYALKAMTTRMPSCDNPLYMLLEIASEAGELQGKFAKAIRKETIVFKGGNDFESAMSSEEYGEWIEGVASELGDILWGIAGLSSQLGFSLEGIARMNLEKLAKRKKNGTIDGCGDGVTKEERGC